MLLTIIVATVPINPLKSTTDIMKQYATYSDVFLGEFEAHLELSPCPDRHEPGKQRSVQY